MAKKKPHADNVGQDVSFKSRAVSNITISVYPRDEEMIQWLAAHFGCSRSEAVRTAIRSMVAALSNERRQR